ncbi:MAG: TonB family protein [Bacteroidetes bacterium]|nr:TonB family protein [Bacteroidota bacterium]
MNSIFFKFIALITLIQFQTKAQILPDSLNKSNEIYRSKFESFMEEGEEGLRYWNDYIVTYSKIEKRYVLRFFQEKRPFLLSETRFKEMNLNTKDGRCLTLNPETLTYDEGEYSENHKTGQWISKDTMNNTLAIYFYNYDLLSQNARFFYPSGALQKTGQYEYGNNHGTWLEYYENGLIKQERTFNVGIIDGVANYYDSTGNLILKDIFNQGDLKETVIVNKELYSEELKKRNSFLNETKTGIIYSAVERQPDFVGGHSKMYDWIKDNLIYPLEEKDNRKTGNVYVKFIVEKDGSIGDVLVLKGLGYNYDKEAIRLVKSMPRWNPGIQSGKLVRVYFNMPIPFK